MKSPELKSKQDMFWVSAFALVMLVFMVMEEF